MSLSMPLIGHLSPILCFHWLKVILCSSLFALSSAPEVHDSFTVHIRGVGEWTNRVYKHFEDEYERQKDGVNTRENK